MARGNKEMTIVVPGLSRSDAISLKHDFIELKNRIAPESKASIAIGEKERFSDLAQRCSKKIRG